MMARTRNRYEYHVPISYMKMWWHGNELLRKKRRIYKYYCMTQLVSLPADFKILTQDSNKSSTKYKIVWDER